MLFIPMIPDHSLINILFLLLQCKPCIFQSFFPFLLFISFSGSLLHLDMLKVNESIGREVVY